MKRLLFLLMAALLVLAACEDQEDNDPVVESSEQGESDVEQDEIETLLSKETDLILFDNDDLKLTLLRVSHGRSETTDHVSLKVKMENQQKKTFEFYIENLTVDNKAIEITHLWIDDNDIKPNETIETTINGYEYEEFMLEEYIAGTIIYRDYEGNRNVIEFGEYIND